jgi:DNA-binding response OmpR family regulator
LPDIDGHRVARRIRSSARPGTPIIAISGTSWLADRDEFDTVISKPFDITTLLGTINELLTRCPAEEGAMVALNR